VDCHITHPVNISMTKKNSYVRTVELLCLRRKTRNGVW
jgi:hypothetical protein